ncbi:MAG: hypothetical protein U1F61_09705 [Opitutaceae bacterium]
MTQAVVAQGLAYALTSLGQAGSASEPRRRRRLRGRGHAVFVLVEPRLQAPDNLTLRWWRQGAAAALASGERLAALSPVTAPPPFPPSPTGSSSIATPASRRRRGCGGATCRHCREKLGVIGAFSASGPEAAAAVPNRPRASLPVRATLAVGPMKAATPGAGTAWSPIPGRTRLFSSNRQTPGVAAVVAGGWIRDPRDVHLDRRRRSAATGSTRVAAVAERLRAGGMVIRPLSSRRSATN